MGQRSAKPAQSQHPAEPSAPSQTQLSGLTPRNRQARSCCNPKRVRSLIKSGRLGPCWTRLPEGEGGECSICVELYGKLNLTACCCQEICTECFITIVAPSGLVARCPYCQSAPLQVFLPPPTQQLPQQPPTQQQQSPGYRGAADQQALDRQQAPPLATPASSQQRHLPATGKPACASTTTTTTSGSRAKLEASPAAGTASRSSLLLARAAQLTEDMHGSLQASSSGGDGDSARGPECQPGAAGNAPACPAAVLPPHLRFSTRALAEAAAAASRQQGPAIVGMMLQTSQTIVAAPPGAAAGSGASSSSSCQAASATQAAASGSGSTAAIEPAAGVLGLASPAGGPALLVNPDGTEQVVLLRSAQSEAEEEERRLATAGAGYGQQQQAGAAAVAQQLELPSYQAPATPDDNRVRQAIEHADAALRQPSAAVATALVAGPAPASSVGDSAAAAGGGSVGWLERMQQADAALRAAVARNDQQRFGSGSGASEGD